MSKHVSKYAQWQKRIANTYKLMHNHTLNIPLPSEDAAAVREVLDTDPEEIRMACYRLGMDARQLADTGLLDDIDSVLKNWREYLLPRGEDIVSILEHMGYQVTAESTVFSEAFGFPYLDDVEGSGSCGVQVTDGGGLTVYWWFDTDEGYLHRREDRIEQVLDVNGMPTWLAVRFVLYGNPTQSDVESECAKMGCVMRRYAYVGGILQVARYDDDHVYGHWLETDGMSAREVAQWIMTGEEPEWRHAE